jgi:hypothetical protein
MIRARIGVLIPIAMPIAASASAHAGDQLGKHQQNAGVGFGRIVEA